MRMRGYQLDMAFGFALRCAYPMTQTQFEITDLYQNPQAPFFYLFYLELSNVIHPGKMGNLYTVAKCEAK